MSAPAAAIFVVILYSSFLEALSLRSRGPRHLRAPSPPRQFKSLRNLNDERALAYAMALKLSSCYSEISISAAHLMYSPEDVSSSGASILLHEGRLSVDCCRLLHSVFFAEKFPVNIVFKIAGSAGTAA